MNIKKLYLKENGLINNDSAYRAEFERRARLLGIWDKEFADIGKNGVFFPVDPEAAPWHPEWKKTRDFGGGFYRPDGAFVSECDAALCGMPCCVCQFYPEVVRHGADKEQVARMRNL